MFAIDLILKESPNPTYIKDREGKIVWANVAYAKLHKCSLEQIVKKGVVDFDFSFDKDLEVITTGESCKVEEFYKVEQGRGAWFNTSKTIVQQPDGSYYLLSTSAEITNLKESLRTAEDSFTNNEKFLENLSRELDAPINAIKSLVSLLKKTFINKEQKKYINTVLSISDYLLDVPKDIIEYAKIKAGLLENEVEATDIVGFVHNSVRQLASKALEHDVTIHFSEPLTKIPLIEINPAYLSQILTKFITCAIRYTKSKNIIVSFFQKERLDKVLYLQFSIHNIVLDPYSEELENIFNSQTEDEDQVYKNGTTELGILTSKKIIKLQGGKIWLENKSGQGASIEFILPFTIHSDFFSEKIPAYVSPEHSKKLNLLLVEDNESSQILVKHQVQFWNTKFDVAANGEEGIKLALEQEYDLILMDLEMPVIDGFEATSFIRSVDGPNQQTPIVAFSANIETDNLKKYKEVGFTDYLSKPYHAFDLYSCVSKNTGFFTKEQQLGEKEFDESDTPLFDFSALGDMAEDSVFIRKMQKLFIDVVPEQIKKLTVAIRQEDWSTVALIAHSLKSTYGNIKVTKAANAMKRIEVIANSETGLSELEILLSIAEETTQKVIRVFKEELQNKAQV